ncbi:hypothetical protein [Ruminococcus flavefaciens]|uniref:hypothetical protein n=1 Tax=Ruminococcus flavefaciens TaxID=1265 RepID=UPI0026F0AE76|nr:hypothetical protein [Ruminococcus flavefaciens]MDD7516507.1 hypothetical protein [Ruminococcus flavefaciens]MDY5690781.1 hypothetical protein [Ruminococcus flavefaciens]
MKKNFLLALAAVAAISFTGCGRETVGPATPSDVRPTSNSAVTTSAYDWNCQEMCSRRIPKILDRQESGSVMRSLL